MCVFVCVCECVFTSRCVTQFLCLSLSLVVGLKSTPTHPHIHTHTYLLCLHSPHPVITPHFIQQNGLSHLKGQKKEEETEEGEGVGLFEVGKWYGLIETDRLEMERAKEGCGRRWRREEKVAQCE